MKKVWKAGIAGLAALSIGAVGFVGTTAAFAVDYTDEELAAAMQDPANKGLVQLKVNKTNNLDRRFNVLQLFTGTVHNSTLSNVEAGANFKRPDVYVKDADGKDVLNLPAAFVNGADYASLFNEKKTDWRPTTKETPAVTDDEIADKVLAYVAATYAPVTDGNDTDADGNTIAASSYAAQKALTDFLNLFTDATNPVETVGAGKSVLVTPGYYMLQEVGTPTAEGITANASSTILTITGRTEVSPKSDTDITSEKKVDDVNDSTGAKDELQDSADYDIGDRVPFTYTTKVPSNYDSFDEYNLTFHDYQSAGLTFDKVDSITVQNYKTDDGKLVKDGDPIVIPAAQEKTDDTPEVKGYTVTTTGFDKDDTVSDENEKDGKIAKTFTVSMNLKDFTGINAGAIVTVKYGSYLNENAKVNAIGNPNYMKMEFSSNPNDTTKTNETTLDKNIVFTFEATGNKVDKDGVAVEGAEFALFKKVLNEGGQHVENTTDEEGNVIVVGRYDWYVYTPATSDKDDHESRFTLWTGAEPTTMTKEQADAIGAADTKDNPNPNKKYSIAANGGDDGNQVKFSGIDDGDYVMVETVTPAGYNTMEPKTFTVSATHDKESEDPKLDNYTANNVFQVLDENKRPVSGLTGNIINLKGNELPSTGGMGTTMLYVAGGVIVLIAGIGMAVALRRRQA